MLDHFGNRGVSRITGAKDAIKSVLSDSSKLSSTIWIRVMEWWKRWKF